jgi:hypothetical protein
MDRYFLTTDRNVLERIVTRTGIITDLSDHVSRGRPVHAIPEGFVTSGLTAFPSTGEDPASLSTDVSPATVALSLVVGSDKLSQSSDHLY